MIAKIFEVRDRGTFIPVVAIKIQPANEKERYLAGRVGYGRTQVEQSRFVLLARLEAKGEVTYDPYGWKGRTLHEAHLWLNDHFDEVETGAVIDVEFILGETTTPKKSEWEE